MEREDGLMEEMEEDLQKWGAFDNVDSDPE